MLVLSVFSHFLDPCPFADTDSKDPEVLHNVGSERLETNNRILQQYFMINDITHRIYLGD